MPHGKISPTTPADSRWFPISFRRAGLDRLTIWFDTLAGGGAGRSGVLVSPSELRVRMGDFRLAVPRSSVRSVARSHADLGGTRGVHFSRGRLQATGAPDGLVELTLDPPGQTGRSLSTTFTEARVDTLVLSLEDPDGFVAEFAAGPVPGPESGGPVPGPESGGSGPRAP
jgi:hypothetical protein